MPKLRVIKIKSKTLLCRTFIGLNVLTSNLDAEIKQVYRLLEYHKPGENTRNDSSTLFDSAPVVPADGGKACNGPGPRVAVPPRLSRTAAVERVTVPVVGSPPPNSGVVSPSSMLQLDGAIDSPLKPDAGTYIFLGTSVQVLFGKLPEVVCTARDRGGWE